MKKTICITAICFALWGCEPTLIAEFEDKPVVSCYLDAGFSPVLTVGKLIAFRDDAVYSDEDVSALSITVADLTAGQTYLFRSVGGGRYECPELVAQAGSGYELSFTYNGLPISASTTVPEAPRDVEFSDSSIEIMVFEDESAKMSSRAMGGIDITWSNDEGDYYIVEGYTNSSSAVRESDEELAKTFKLDYTQGNSASLSQAQFNYFGSYEVSVIRILAEYAVMSQGSGDTSETLTDIRGNIDGGYGLFTGINRYSKTITVKKTTSPF